MSKLVLIFLPLLLFTVFSCITTVNDHLPRPSEIKTFTYGMYIDAVKTKGNFKTRYIEGELIAVENNKMCVLTSEKKEPLQFVDKDHLKKASISISLQVEDPKRFESWNNIISAIHLAHGFWNILTGPFSGANRYSVVKGAIKKGYFIEYPKDIGWDDLSRFARFPQGIPPNIDVQDIKRNEI